MKWILLFLLFAACAQVIEEPSGNVKTEETVEIEPLELVFNTDEVEAELKLETAVACSAIGGVPPYKSTVKVSGEEVECDGTCDIVIEEIGNHKIECIVMDSEFEVVSSSAVLKVIKEQIEISNVIVVGDSLSYGEGIEDREKIWPSLYARNLDEAKLVNLAKSGDTTLGVIHGQFTLLEEYSGKNLVFLWIGANDARNLISFEDFRDNYKAIVTRLLLIENSELILINIPDASQLQVAEDIETDVNDFLGDFGIQLEVRQIGKDVITRYNEIISEIAADNELQLIDMFSYMEEFDEGLVLEDGFHPNELGHTKIKQKITLETTYPEREFV